MFKKRGFWLRERAGTDDGISDHFWKEVTQSLVGRAACAGGGSGAGKKEIEIQVSGLQVAT